MHFCMIDGNRLNEFVAEQAKRLAEEGDDFTAADTAIVRRALEVVIRNFQIQNG